MQRSTKKQYISMIGIFYKPRKQIRSNKSEQLRGLHIGYSDTKNRRESTVQLW